MTPAAYYNEIDPFAAQWLRNLIASGHIAPGEVDERSIEDVTPDDLRGFTQRYGLDRLVYFRGFGDVREAIHFEKQLKRWRRAWKIRLIEEDNPHWADLYLDMMAMPPLHPDLVGIARSET